MSFGNDDHKGRPYEWTVNEPPIRWNPCADGFTNRPYVGVISVRLASLNPPYRSASEPSGDPRPTPVSSALRPNRKACGRLPSPRRQRQPTSPFTRLTNSLSSPRFAPLPADQIPIFDCQHQRQKAKTCTLPIPTQRRFFAPWADEKRSALGDLDWLVGAVREPPLRPRMGWIIGIFALAVGVVAVMEMLEREFPSNGGRNADLLQEAASGDAPSRFLGRRESCSGSEVDQRARKCSLGAGDQLLGGVGFGCRRVTGGWLGLPGVYGVTFERSGLGVAAGEDYGES